MNFCDNTIVAGDFIRNLGKKIAVGSKNVVVDSSKAGENLANTVSRKLGKAVQIGSNAFEGAQGAALELRSVVSYWKKIILQEVLLGCNKIILG